ncbi:MAG TPA: SgcJ/EcaC family oxidoreductase [Tepidiformaceae bacterium]|nr:SgcJ/EcaC family oxidoreductase [Tepidiformaceae bacterium]
MSDPSPLTVAEGIFARLEHAWNAGDGAAFGEPFADQTDFIDIRGVLHRGDGALIGEEHQGIFDTIYRGSSIRYRVRDVRTLTSDCILAHATGTLDAPGGPLQGVHTAIATAVIVGEGGGARITAFHNTLITEPSALPKQ